MGNASLSDCEKDTCLALVLDSAIIVCSLDFHVRRHCVYMTAYPVRDFAVSGLCSASACIHEPVNSASAKTSRSCASIGDIIRPLSLVLHIYFAKCIRASSFDLRGLLQKHAHWWTVYAMSGLVHFSRKFNFPTTDL